MATMPTERLYNDPAGIGIFTQAINSHSHWLINYLSPSCFTDQLIISNEYYLSLISKSYCTMSEQMGLKQEPLSPPPDHAEESSQSSTDKESDNDVDDIPFRTNEWIVGDEVTGKTRPPRQNEFLQLLLENPRYASYIEWLNRDEGFFKILEPERVAGLWCRVKNRRTQGLMNYETFARGIRYYYKTGAMIKTHKKYTFRFKIAR